MKRRTSHLGSVFVNLPALICISCLGWAADVHVSSKNRQTLPFTDLPKYVKERNDNVEAARLHMSAQESRTGRLGRSLLPQFSASAGKELFKTGSDEEKSQEYWNLEATVNLYHGGRDRIEDKIRDSTFNLSKTGFIAEYRNELKEARQYYWQIVTLNLIIANRKDALARNNESQKIAKRRAGVGLTTNADASQFELQRISLERELDKLDLEKDAALNRLSVILGLDDHKSIIVDSDFPEVTEMDLKQLDKPADELLPVKIQKNLEEIESLKAEQTARWWYPKVDLYSTYGLPSLTEEYDHAIQKRTQWSAGVRVTIDLEQGLEDRVESKARLTETSAFKRRSAAAIRKGLAASHDLSRSMAVISHLIKLADQDVQAALNFLKLTETEYNRGVKNGPDLLQATQTYYSYREKRIGYYRDYYNAKAEQDNLLSEEQP